MNALDLLPLPVMGLLAVAVVFLVWRYFGLKAALAAGAAALAALYTKFIRKSAKDEVRREARINDLETANDIHETAADARAESDRVNADPERLRDADANCRDC